MKIDTHHHFWDYDPKQYGWISDKMSVLKRDFGPTDLQKEIQSAGIDAVVSVQARQTLEETRWLIEIAEKTPFVAGVVGWVPLMDRDVDKHLDELHAHEVLRGVRHVVHDEPDDNFILGSDFNRGVDRLQGFGLVYDLLIFAKHLGATIKFVDQHPGQPMVLDHIAKPVIRDGQFHAEWDREFRELAKRDNVTCKFSGVATEVRDESWTIDTVRPYWDSAWESFGPDRLMFGSDWPVCLLMTEYKRWVDTVSTLAGELSKSEQQAFWSDTAAMAYGLSL